MPRSPQFWKLNHHIAQLVGALLALLASLAGSAASAADAELYLPKSAVADPAHAAASGVHFAEWLTGSAIGAPRQPVDASPLKFTFDDTRLRQRVLSISADTELVVLDVLEGALQTELKLNKRGERHRVAMYLRSVREKVRELTALPILFDGLPGGGANWSADALAAVFVHAGISPQAVTCYWTPGHSRAQYLAQFDGARALAMQPLPGALIPPMPAAALISLDDAHALLAASPADQAAVFAHMQEKGIRMFVAWRNPTSPPLTREQLTAILNAVHAAGEPAEPAEPSPEVPPDSPGEEQPPPVPPDSPGEEHPNAYWSLTARARENGIGVNLGPNDPWDTTWPWRNMLHQAQFRTPTYGYSSPQDVKTKEILLMIGHECGTNWPGSPGSWLFDAAGGAKPNNQPPANKTNEGIQLRIGPDTRGLSPSATLIASDWPATESGFHKVFLDRLAPVAGYVRFMDWEGTNNSTKRNWSDEVVDDGTGFYSKLPSVPLARMIDLCNEIGAYPWFCIPHLATDDYVRQFARFVRDRLDPRLVPIIELSNECWNQGMFEQARHFGSAAAYAARARQVMTIIRQELPNSFRVIASQEDNLGISDQVLAGDCSMFTHLAVGFYIGYWMDGSTSTPSDPVAIIENARRDIDRLVNNLQQHKAKAAAKGLRLIGYEGGLHLVGVGNFVDAYYARFKAANRHALAGDVEHELRERTKGLLEFRLQYTFCGRDSKWGMWGALEWIGADPATQHRYLTLRADAQEAKQ